jgi:plasmid stabilization system protein ParE
MSRPLILRPEAEADLFEAKLWYEGRREGLAEEFRECIEEVMDRIRLMPELQVEIYKGVRRRLVRRFPFAVFYKTEETRILNIAVMHARREPGRWRARV